MTFEKFSKNGLILPIDQATARLDDTAFTYGYGVYETLKIRNNTLYFPELHAQRLLNSAKTIELQHDLTEQKIILLLKELQKQIKEESYNFKILLIANNQNADIYIIPLAPLYPKPEYYTQGVKVITYQGERQYPQAKTLNMLTSFIAYKKAKEQQAYDALLIDNQGNIREGTRTNIIYEINNQLYTPPLSTILEGVTLITLCQALQEKNIHIQERELKLTEINQCQSILILSTSTKTAPIRQINNQTIPTSQTARQIIKTYDEYLQKYKNEQK